MLEDLMGTYTCVRETKTGIPPEELKEIDKLQDEVEKLRQVVDVLTDNKKILLDMFTKAVEQVAHEKRRALKRCRGVDEISEWIELQEALIQDFYAAFSDLDDKYHRLTGEYLQ